MTSPDPMSREELLELAPLDVYGLLDEFEAALFNRSFHHAAPSVQAEIRALQAQLAEDPTFLAGDEPRPLLRQKVLVHVADAVEVAVEQLKPLATIGSPFGNGIATMSAEGSASTATLANRAASIDIPDSQDETMRELVAEIRARASFGDRERSTPYWRAAAFFLAASLVVSLYFLGSTMRTAERIAEFAQNRVISEQLREAVPDLTDFIFRDSRNLTLASVDLSVDATAMMIVNPATRETLLLAFGLDPSKGLYTLRSVDEQGNATVIKSFGAEGPVSYASASLPADFLTRKFELLDSTGKVILRSA